MREEVALRRQITRTSPPRFHSIDVFTELFGNEFLCPRLHIEVGVRGHVPRDVLTWAKDVVSTYGSDRVQWRYYAEATVETPVAKR